MGSDIRTRSYFHHPRFTHYTLSPSLPTDFRFGYYRYLVRVRPGGLDTTPAKDAGIPGLNVDEFTGGMPAIAYQPGEKTVIRMGYGRKL